MSVEIEFEKVCYSYAEGASVNDLSFTIEKGAFAAIIGGNGAGKTTVSKLIRGLLLPSSGKVTVAGCDTAKTKVSSLAKKIGFLFQDPDRQLCRENALDELMFGLSLVGIGRDTGRERSLALLDKFGIDPAGQPFSLSRGERQTLALLSVLVCEPEILILDEPTTGLDYTECVRLMDAVKERRENGTTVVMVCHDMELVLDYAESAMVMSGGKMIAKGPVKDIFTRYDIMEKGSIAPPQIASLSNLLGGPYAGATQASEIICAYEKTMKA